jgi:hypothetical protein
MATVPTPLDATAAVKITATSFDAGVRDPLNFLLDPPKCDLAMKHVQERSKRYRNTPDL